MEQARQFLSPEHDEVSEFDIRPHRAGQGSFYEALALRGIQVEQVQRGSLVCTFKVPRRLTGAGGNMCSGAIANLVDDVGWAAVLAAGHQSKVSVDMSISFMSTPKVHDELQITSRVLGHKGGYSGTIVLVTNKSRKEIVAEGRHSLFGNLRSKL